MEAVGHHDGGVSSICCSSTNESVLITAGDDERVRLWDLRLKKKQLMTFGGDSSSTPLPDVGEILLNHNGSSFTIAAACGGAQLHSIDVRQPFGFCGSLTIPTGEDVSFLFDSHKCPPPANHLASAWEIVVGDDNGALFVVDTSTWALQEASEQIEGFGNLCCGMGVTANRCLWSVSMGGALHGFELLSAPSFQGLAKKVYAGNVSEIRLQSTAQSVLQLHNPPIPTCLTTCGNQIVVGRGDGTYSVYETDSDFKQGSAVEELLGAPAHQSNGLVSIEWINGVLFTAALSGEITGWDVASFLSTEPNDDADGDLPQVLFAETIRQTPSAMQIINCCSYSLAGSIVVGDTSGTISLIPTAA